MDFNKLIRLEFTWGHSRHKNTVNGIYLNDKLLLDDQPRKYKELGNDISSGYWASNPTAASFAICKAIYGEILAGQLWLQFEDWWIDAVYEAKGKYLTLDMDKFNARYLNPITYFDMEATVSWYAEPLHVNMHQDASVGTFKFLRMPISNLVWSAMGDDLIGAYFQDHAERYTYLEIMHNHTVRDVQYKRSAETTAEPPAAIITETK